VLRLSVRVEADALRHRRLAGETITFSTKTTTFCSATTNAAGVASCDLSLANAVRALLFGFNANFAGDLNYIPALPRGGDGRRRRNRAARSRV